MGLFSFDINYPISTLMLVCELFCVSFMIVNRFERPANPRSTAQPIQTIKAPAGWKSSIRELLMGSEHTLNVLHFALV